MKNLIIPEEDLQSLILFETQSTNVKNSIIKIFSDFEKGQSHDLTAEKIADITTISYEDSMSIVSVYFALLRTISVYSYAQEEFITNIVNNSTLSYKLNLDKKNKLNNAIRTLLTIENKNALLTTLAMYVMTQNSNIITGFNVFSDLKPIKCNNQFSGLALSNILKIRYRGESNDENQSYFTFDSEDLDELIVKLNELKEANQQLKSKYGDDIIEI